jgi:hypothetical protein
MHAADRKFERLRQLCPILASLDVCVCVVCNGVVSMMLLDMVTSAHIPTATDFPSSSSSLATLRHLSLCFLVSLESKMAREEDCTVHSLVCPD